MNARNEAFDAAKGFLMLLVIIGHALLGSISENPVRQIIYFFHMPVFLAISGYFIKDALLERETGYILNKYLHRVLVPFAAAFIFYTSYNVITQKIYSLKNILYLILYPYYHLWYIPAIILFIFYAKLLKKLPGIAHVLALLLVFLSTAIFEGYGQDLFKNTFYYLLGDKRFYCYFLYFYAGYCFSSKNLKIGKFLSITIFASGLLLFLCTDHRLLVGLGKSVSNIGIILLLLSHLVNSTFKSTFLAKIGKVSLPIYLWHVFPLLVLRRFSFPEPQYYALCVLFFTLFVYLIIRGEGMFIYLDKYLYGVDRSSPVRSSLIKLSTPS